MHKPCYKQAGYKTMLDFIKARDPDYYNFNWVLFIWIWKPG